MDQLKHLEQLQAIASCSSITDDEAQDWPLYENLPCCSECGRTTGMQCGYCGEQLCNHIECIKRHADKGCKEAA
jgi:hypothetical protein